MTSRLTSVLIVLGMVFGSAAFDATIRWYQTYQRITGFGAGTGDSNFETPQYQYRR